MTLGTDIEAAAHLMLEKKNKKLPVTNQKRLVGIISLTDISCAQPSIAKALQKLATLQETSKSIKKVLNSYIV
ncbi:MAG: CBS domain-containing protein [Candidatus Bathyarchaeia archaeon]